MVESKLTYEEARKQRLEENKRRMEELNLNKLSQSLRNASPKNSLDKQVKPRVPKVPLEPTPVRRSSRMTDKPPPNYREALLEPWGSARRSYKRRDLLNRVYASDEERHYALQKAEHVQYELGSNFPSFVKPMLQSHVTRGFWLGLPVHFCKEHLPHQDEMLTLVDEQGNASLTKYLAQKTGLSGGWRGFAIDHELVDGDALVFQLTKSTEFKVFIIRAYESEDNNEQSDATNLEKIPKRMKTSKK